MLIDGNLQFTGTAGTAGSPDNPTTGTQQSNNIIDLLNGRDLGVGDDPALKLLVQVTTAFLSGISLQVQVQGAPDNGSGSPGTWVTLAYGPIIVEAALILGTRLLDIDLPRLAGAVADGRPGVTMALPRFLRLQYVTVGMHSAGGVFGAMVLDREDNVSYPPGITINN